jgi:hypothetical protein
MKKDEFVADNTKEIKEETPRQVTPPSPRKIIADFSKTIKAYDITNRETQTMFQGSAMLNGTTQYHIPLKVAYGFDEYLIIKPTSTFANTLEVINVYKRTDNEGMTTGYVVIKPRFNSVKLNSGDEIAEIK